MQTFNKHFQILADFKSFWFGQIEFSIATSFICCEKHNEISLCVNSNLLEIMEFK